MIPRSLCAWGSETDQYRGRNQPREPVINDTTAAAASQRHSDHCDFCLMMFSSADQDGHSTQCNDARRLTAKQQARNTAPTVRCHDDQVAIPGLRCREDPLSWKIADVHRFALNGHVLRVGTSLGRSACSAAAFSYSSIGKSNARLSPLLIDDHGSVAVTTTI